MNGIEFLVTPSGANPGEVPGEESYSWQSTRIGVPEPRPLNNFRVSFRYYENTAQPGMPEIRGYPGFTLISNSLTAVSPDSDLYTTETGDELFDAPEEAYGPNAYAVAGITDGTAYAYTKVFDQTNFRIIETYPERYIPPEAPPAIDGSVQVDVIPLEPYDPDNNIYPFEAVTAYNPDPRNFVTVTYNIKATVRAPLTGIEYSDEINITQQVTQSINDWSKACVLYVERGAYTNGLYNNDYTKRQLG